VIATLSVAAGLLLALGVVCITRKMRHAAASRILAVALVVAAFIYVAFAVGGGADARWIGIEMLGVAVYGSAAWLGFVRWPAILALGWAAHIFWDLALHLSGAGAAYTPAWYPWLCLGFDLPIGVLVLARRRAYESVA
jgi:hypothetical protein